MTDADRETALRWARRWMTDDTEKDPNCACGKCAAARVLGELLDDTPVTANEIVKEFPDLYAYAEKFGWGVIGAMKVKTQGSLALVKVLELQGRRQRRSRFHRSRQSDGREVRPRPSRGGVGGSGTTSERT